jgi:hypothetical protein
VLLSALPLVDATNVPANAKVVLSFNKPMRPEYNHLVLGGTNTTSRSWSSNQMTLTISSSSPWPANVTQSWYLNSFGRLAGFGDTNNSPVMTETFATRFSAGTNTLSATPLAPLLEILRPSGDGAVQLQLTGGEAYRGYKIQASDGLLDWITLDTMVATNDHCIFIDSAPSPTNRSYRAVAMP